ncbi:hypothetical protein [Streptomyces sp. NBC_00094]|uniref:hypothetical protein n=1 Tax=Streptomyces sp. NBC_00094 TaxID=2903620 RepID=UPI002257C3F2|nr:hypothetical protein [Streptomyces sp. NBC_00094]MCX5391154.1 hypothetical protein [Streptomyces sp. NBC_00094]
MPETGTEIEARTMTEAEALRSAYRDLLDAADTVAAAGSALSGPPDGEWGAERILAHVSLVTATTLAAVSAVASGVGATYDNRVAHDPWTLDHVVELAGGAAGLRERIRVHGEALCVLGVGPALSEAELGTPVPTLLVSHDTLMVDGPVPLRDLVAGLAAAELPGHTKQLLSLV